MRVFANIMVVTNTSIQTWKYAAGSGVAAVAISANGETVIAGTLGKRVLCLDGSCDLYLH